MSTLKALAAATAILSVFAAQAAVARDLTIAWVHGNAAAQSEQRVKDGFVAYLKDHNMHWNVSYLDSGGQGEKTASNITDAASRGVDAILITMADLRASRAALTEATAKHIPIFTVDSGWTPGVIVDVTTNNWQMSAEVSAYLVNLMGGKGNVIIFKMDALHATRKRSDTMDIVLKENPDVKVLATHNIDYGNYFEDTQRTMQDYATRFGDKITAVWAPWDEPAQAAINALKAAGLHPYVTGMDGHPPALKSICQPGSLFVATGRQQFEKFGSMSADWIEQIVDQKKDARSVVPTTTVYLPAPLFTKADCASLKS